MFKTGQFGLVSSFKDPAGKLVTQVLGIGIAPLLDGEKAAVSMQLPRLGAKVLWESFQTAAPDISFHFEMEVPGYTSPKRAVVEANWDQIYQHKAFAAGVASKYLGAEIKAAFDDLRRSGAIKVTQIGADTALEALLTTAYNALTTLMFAAVTETGAPSAGGQSLLEKATAMYQNNEKAAIEERDKVRTANENNRKHNAELEKRRRVAEDAERAARIARDRADAEKAKVAEARKQLASDEAAAGRLRKAADDAVARATKLETDAGDDAARKEAAAGARTRGRPLSARRLAEAEAKVAERKTALAQAEAAAAPLATAAETTEKEAAAARAAAPTESEFLPIREEPSSSGGFAAIVTYEMKKSRQSGRYTVDLNKYTAESLTLRFDENIGDLRSLMRDTAHFRQVNLDDPLYRQREVAVFVDGQNAKDFGDYINFVTVQMRKRHQGGDVTLEEVRIDRTTFQQGGQPLPSAVRLERRQQQAALVRLRVPGGVELLRRPHGGNALGEGVGKRDPPVAPPAAPFGRARRRSEAAGRTGRALGEREGLLQSGAGCPGTGQATDAERRRAGLRRRDRVRRTQEPVGLRLRDRLASDGQP